MTTLIAWFGFNPHPGVVVVDRNFYAWTFRHETFRHHREKFFFTKQVFLQKHFNFFLKKNFLK